jgi:hypothetical protein
MMRGRSGRKRGCIGAEGNAGGGGKLTGGFKTSATGFAPAVAAELASFSLRFSFLASVLTRTRFFFMTGPAGKAEAAAAPDTLCCRPMAELSAGNVAEKDDAARETPRCRVGDVRGVESVRISFEVTLTRADAPTLAARTRAGAAVGGSGEGLTGV